jgi:50S ribosomal protein L16 3-hydroxylase
LSRLKHAPILFQLVLHLTSAGVATSLHIIARMSLRLLGGLTPREFLRRHWQKRPLFVRRALPGFKEVLSAQALARLSLRDDVESRMVQRRGNRWNTEHGPFRSLRPQKRDWTLLVSGVNLHARAAEALLRRFSFIPQARLDDVMVSYATPGGGVGPHVDSYDVFLVQGAGRRRWTVWDPRGKASTWVSARGDLLYVPPGWRHDGVALEPCFTYSVGFRAPSGAELGAAFLDWLHERGLPEARYGDPGLVPAMEPGRIPPDLVDFAEKLVSRIRWTRADVERFLGEYLSMPKPHVVFRPEGRRRGGGPALRSALVRLDAKTQLLHAGRRFFINGESVAVAPRAARALRRLADERAMGGAALARARLGRLISLWRAQGYLHVEAMHGR